MTETPIRFFVDLLLVSCLALPLFYWARSERFRRLLLTFVGGYLVLIAAPHLILFWVPFWGFVWMANWGLDKMPSDRGRSALFWLAATIALTPMVYWKALDGYFLLMLNEPLRAVFETVFPAREGNETVMNLVVPIGLSFSTFRALDFLICRHLEIMPRQSVLEVFFVGFFPPVLLIGPIAQSSELLQPAGGGSVLRGENVYENIAQGAAKMAVGLAKIYVLSLPLIESTAVVAEYQLYSAGYVWVHVFINAWYFYLNFAGFSDLAIGSARLYGYRINENFSYPYFRRNLQQFWASWHMSLTGFAQRNVFIPLGGFRPKTQYFAAFVTMMVIALWHDLSWALIVFGLLHSSVLIGLRFVQVHRPGSGPLLPAVPAMLITFVFVALTVPLVTVPDIDPIDYFHHILFLGVPR